MADDAARSWGSSERSRRVVMAWGMCVAVACAPSEVPPEATPAPSAPERTPRAEPSPEPVPEPTPAPAPAPIAASSLSWLWYHRLPPKIADSVTEIGLGSVAYDHRVGDPRMAMVEPTDEGISLGYFSAPEREGDVLDPPRWTRTIATPTSAAPVVQMRLTQPATVAVALLDDADYSVHVFDDEGNDRFATTVSLPAGFEAPGATLELGGSAPDRLVVYVRGRSEALLDELDAHSGEPKARRRFDATVLHETPPSTGTKATRLGHRWPGADGDYAVVRRGKAIVLQARDGKRHERWTTTLEPEHGRWTDMAVALEQGDAVIVAAYTGGSSGAAVYAVGREDGTLRETLGLGVGPIGHSRYSNEVALGTDARGHVLVLGHESGGDYVGVIDVGTSTLLGHEIWRR